jgi:hypothetical protein
VRKDKLELLQGTLDMLVLKTLNVGPLDGYGFVDRILRLSSEVIRVEEAIRIRSLGLVPDEPHNHERCDVALPAARSR